MLMPPKTATASVAIIKSIVPQESFLILRRAAHPADPWSGHFSFPGGRIEAEDNSILETCIRETIEEVGVTLTLEMLQTQLPVTPAGRDLKSPVWVQPFIFNLHDRPTLTLNAREVQSVCWLNSKEFQNKKNHREVELLPDQLFPAFPIEDYYLWGFTYKLLKSILNM